MNYIARKDLRTIWQDQSVNAYGHWTEKNTILLDDTVGKAQFTPDNGLHLPTFTLLDKTFDCQNDTSLLSMIKYLRELREANPEDVRDYMKTHPAFHIGPDNTATEPTANFVISDEFDGKPLSSIPKTRPLLPPPAPDAATLEERLQRRAERRRRFERENSLVLGEGRITNDHYRALVRISKTGNAEDINLQSDPCSAGKSRSKGRRRKTAKDTERGYHTTTRPSSYDSPDDRTDYSCTNVTSRKHIRFNDEDDCQRDGEDAHLPWTEAKHSAPWISAGNSQPDYYPHSAHAGHSDWNSYSSGPAYANQTYYSDNRPYQGYYPSGSPQQMYPAEYQPASGGAYAYPAYPHQTPYPDNSCQGGATNTQQHSATYPNPYINHYAGYAQWTAPEQGQYTVGSAAYRKPEQQYQSNDHHPTHIKHKRRPSPYPNRPLDDAQKDR
ncbi:hypothetical protein PhCBS80983_g01243 [Powellomyces hirtus]|uniref:FCP1 homology domain-containing protein n=1 Tax=Powellomyces hirtus TaxID=109895 RepID=A0A507EAR8_9FUNG|nr:hypothetical protein PhCBS80983_g01243 [Powellomyces hirtus]